METFGQWLLRGALRRVSFARGDGQFPVAWAKTVRRSSMAGYLERVAGGSLSRRGFVRASAVAAATLAAAGGLSACANTVQESRDGTGRGGREVGSRGVLAWLQRAHVRQQGAGQRRRRHPTEIRRHPRGHGGAPATPRMPAREVPAQAGLRSRPAEVPHEAQALGASDGWRQEPARKRRMGAHQRGTKRSTTWPPN